MILSNNLTKLIFIEHSIYQEKNAQNIYDDKTYTRPYNSQKKKKKTEISLIYTNGYKLKFNCSQKFVLFQIFKD